MQYAFQLLPHPNVRYQSALEKLGKAELPVSYTHLVKAFTIISGINMTW